MPGLRLGLLLPVLEMEATTSERLAYDRGIRLIKTTVKDENGFEVDARQNCDLNASIAGNSSRRGPDRRAPRTFGAKPELAQKSS